MDNPGFMLNLIVYLIAAVVMVPIFARIGLGSVLGYLVAGYAIGPWGLGLINNVEDILHFSELGVVFLLFLIGLELEPKKLWKLRQPILGAGGMQMLLSAAVIACVVSLAGFTWQTALLVGLGLALSSTAISLQLINERRLMKTPLGERGFSILLFQDISVIPIIALIPLLTGVQATVNEHGGHASAPMIAGVFIGIFILGRYALRHIFRFVASAHQPEIFTALSLLLVSGLAFLMNSIGVSMALGAFLGGVILADSEYRHALESDIEPFKGLLLGLFFISVGMSIDVGLFLDKPFLILGITLALIFAKSIVLYVVALVSGLPRDQRMLFAFVLSQSGEFAFVIFGFAVTAGVLSLDTADLLILVVAMSMVVTPLLLIAHDRFVEPRFSIREDRPMDEINEDSNVILVGFGRFGQVIGRMLHANKINPTVIENDPDTIERVRQFGYKTYYGDILRHDVLHQVNAQNADMIILTGEQQQVTNETIAMIRRDFPNLHIIVRARDRIHAAELIGEGVEDVTRETFYSAVEMGKKALRKLGFKDSRIDAIARTYVEHDLQTLRRQVEVRDDEKALITLVNSAREQLERTLEADQEDSGEEGDPGHS